MATSACRTSPLVVQSLFQQVMCTRQMRQRSHLHTQFIKSFLELPWLLFSSPLGSACVTSTAPCVLQYVVDTDGQLPLAPVYHTLIREQDRTTSSAESGHGTDVSHGAAWQSDIQSYWLRRIHSLIKLSTWEGLKAPAKILLEQTHRKPSPWNTTHQLVTKFITCFATRRFINVIITASLTWARYIQCTE